MRKKIIEQEDSKTLKRDENWIEVEHLASLEITSEDPEFPIEEAFSINGKSGWKASEAGTQLIRIIFDEPQQINRIHLLIQEEREARTQEFVLRWSPEEGQSFREIVRQQFNFSPASSTKEEENYTLELKNVKILELEIIPDVGGGNARASISRFLIA